MGSNRLRPGRALALGALALLLAGAAPPAGERKRQTPRVLAPVESAAAVARVQVRTYLIQSDRGGRPLLPGLKRPKGGKDGRKGPKVVPVPGADLERSKDAKLAEQVRPLRVAILAASFPYRRQVAEFQTRLG